MAAGLLQSPIAVGEPLDAIHQLGRSLLCEQRHQPRLGRIRILAVAADPNRHARAASNRVVEMLRDPTLVRNGLHLAEEVVILHGAITKHETPLKPTDGAPLSGLLLPVEPRPFELSEPTK